MAQPEKPADKPAYRTQQTNRPTGRWINRLPHQVAEKPAQETARRQAKRVSHWTQVCESLEAGRCAGQIQYVACPPCSIPARLLEVKNNVLVLGFASEILRSKADTPEQIEITRKAIAEVLGVELAVRCVVTNGKAKCPAQRQSRMAWWPRRSRTAAKLLTPGVIMAKGFNRPAGAADNPE